MAVTEKAWSIVSVAEVVSELRIVLPEDGADADLIRTDLANSAARLTELIEAAYDRLFIMGVEDRDFPGGEDDRITEQHDLRKGQTFLYVRHRPIRSLMGVSVRGTALDLATVTGDPRAGLILFQYGSLDPLPRALMPGAPVGNFDADFPDDWAARFGSRQGIAPGAGVAEVTYLGGYEDTAHVPGDLKELALDGLARLWRSKERKNQGLSAISTGLGLATKLDDAWFNNEALERLRSKYGNLSSTARDPMPIAETP